MKFLLEILGMTNQCNLRCSYCDWVKDEYIALGKNEISNVRRNLSSIKKVLDENYKEIQLIEYSGGEPLVYPEIVNILLEQFKDKWIRIITNGVAINDDILSSVSNHGKTFLAISLDGCNLEANNARFQGNNKLFQHVLKNIDKVVERKIPLMLLCTLSKYNIDYFPDYIEYLQNKYSEAIEAGMLVMPTHYVTNYSKDNGVPSKEQVEKFEKFINGKGMDYPIISNIKEHYYCLIQYAKHNPKPYGCKINEWNISMHFRKNEIIDAGKFLNFGCGMRGVEENGFFNINDKKDVDTMINIINSPDYYMDFENQSSEALHKDRLSGYNDLDENCYGKCFVDWTIIDLILRGIVNYEDAKKWFVMFRSQSVEKFVMEYKNNQKAKKLISQFSH